MHPHRFVDSTCSCDLTGPVSLQHSHNSAPRHCCAMYQHHYRKYLKSAESHVVCLGLSNAAFRNSTAQNSLASCLAGGDDDRWRGAVPHLLGDQPPVPPDHPLRPCLCFPQHHATPHDSGKFRHQVSVHQHGAGWMSCSTGNCSFGCRLQVGLVQPVVHLLDCITSTNSSTNHYQYKPLVMYQYAANMPVPT